MAECKDFAEKLGIRPGQYEIVTESFSAKESDKREKFRYVLQQLYKGRVQGLIAWHPDRLARNMKEAGEVIDMLDKGIIKDLKFVSFTFTNDDSGKMLLGISFVISKQYSDNLSTNVKRGNVRSQLEARAIFRTR